jgi:hypothetical protein
MPFCSSNALIVSAVAKLEKHSIAAALASIFLIVLTPRRKTRHFSHNPFWML